MSSRRYVSTGFGPVSSAVGMFEPVTMTRSVVASIGVLGEDDGFCANTFETSNAGSPTAAAKARWITPNKLLAFLRMSFFSDSRTLLDRVAQCPESSRSQAATFLGRVLVKIRSSDKIYSAHSEC